MKIIPALFLVMFIVLSAEAGPQPGRGYYHHDSAFRSHSSATHFIARSRDGNHRRFHYGPGGVIVLDPPDDGSDYGLSDDSEVDQEQEAPQDIGNMPYATPTSDPELVISPYEPHGVISVAGIPHGAQVWDPLSKLFFLNP
jgi:hypothetical protein